MSIPSLSLSARTAPVHRRRELPGEALVGTPDAVADVLRRSGETWIVRSNENQPLPTLLELGIGQLPLAMLRVVGVLGRDPARLDLSCFVARVIGVTPTRTLSEVDLERGYQVLTGGQDGRPMTLVIDAAERLTPGVIHYIQFACISAPTLQVIFITVKEFRERLTDFPFLRARLQPDLVVPIGAEPMRDDGSVARTERPPDQNLGQQHDGFSSFLCAEPDPAYALEVKPR